MQRILITLALSLLAAPSLAEVLAEIPDHDEAALVRAVCRARIAEEPTRILLAPNGFYDLERLLDHRVSNSKIAIFPQSGSCTRLVPSMHESVYWFADFFVSGTVTIEGRGAELRLPPAYYPQISGALRLRDVDLVGSRYEVVGTSGRAFITNRGALSMSGVSISNVEYSGCTTTSPEPTVVLDNQGSADLVNTVLYSNAFTYTQPSPPTCDPVEIANTGELTLNNATLHSGLPPIRNIGTGSATVANSLVQGGVLDACRSRTVSLGGNVLVSPGWCLEPHATDQIVSSVLDLVLDTTSRRFIWTAAGSPGIDEAGLGEVPCADVDLRGYLRVDGHCDAGAVERNAAPPFSVETDGMWVDDANDGHYLLINHVGQNRTIVYWQTFDADGLPRWYYGFATPRRNRLVIELSENTGVAFAGGGIGGEVSGDIVGSMALELTDCGRMDIDYDLPEDSGRFSMRPLTALAGRRCDDGPAR